MESVYLSSGFSERDCVVGQIRSAKNRHLPVDQSLINFFQASLEKESEIQDGTATSQQISLKINIISVHGPSEWVFSEHGSVDRKIS